MAVQHFNCIELLTRVESNEEARSGWEVYDQEKTYAQYNKVTYKGSSYMCKQACTGKLPTDTTYWLLIAAKGDTGQGLEIKGTFATLGLLRANITAPEQGDMYNVGTAAPYTIYMWDTTVGSGDWLSQGALQGPRGEKGDTGERGERGDTGARGEKGDTGESGNLLYATFDISETTGELTMNTPEGYDGIDFAINDNGYLGVTI